ncbi:MAG: hypothetical protein FD123_1289 [Bacteroidetes bacterium]|nr:MAG: hypothetical protein FD123_1289 [Bacteroidota bacterium]
MKHGFLLCLSAFLPVLVPAQEFVNGSFEQNGNLCLINTTNVIFNANVKNTRAFGSFKKPDIASSDCGFGSAKEGNWFVGLATSTNNDGKSEAVSLALTQNLVQGKQYTLTFHTRLRHFAPNLEVGLSLNDSTQGSVFYTCSAKAIGTEWTEQTIRFNAPNSGKYITVKTIGNTGNSGTWIDGFVLRTVFVPENIVKVSNLKPAPAEPEIQKTTTAELGMLNAAIFPNPSPDGNFTINTKGSGELNVTVYNMLGNSIRQLTCPADSTAPAHLDLTAEQPGLYFVELASASSKVIKRVVVTK